MTTPSTPQASYALLPHLASMAPDPDAWASSRWLVLIDAGQHPGLTKRVLRQVPAERSALLYKDTFAENAMQLSPLLLELSASYVQACDELKRLDALCAKWPIMSLIQTQHTAAQWLTHLRTLLRLQMEGTPYLWRLADTQVLQATASVLNPTQRSVLLSPCQSWWIATDEGLAQDLATSQVNADTVLATEPMQLDAEQAKALLTAAAVPTLIGQLRALAPGFTTQLSHIEQSRFARACVEAARAACLDEDAELLDWAVERWSQQNADLTTQAAPLLQIQS